MAGVRVLNGVVALAAARLAVAYFALGSLWIAGTDWLLTRVGRDAIPLGQTGKGLLFVAFGALLVYVFTARWNREREASTADLARMERRLAAVARFEAIGRLTGSIAHDFNNLITAITGNIAAYTSQLGSGEPPHELREARRAADRASDLTRQLLAYGRRQVMRPERVDVNQVIGGMSALLKRLIGEPVVIRHDLAEDLLPVHVDRGRLEQVVMNLAINARDAMPRGGELRIRTRNERITEDHADRFPFPVLPGHYVRIDVVDTGAGMPPEIQAHIFEPFFTTKPQGVGTGLGLATVYGIVKQSAGYVTVESAAGEGSTFTVLLPESSVEEAEADAREHTGADTTPDQAATGGPGPGTVEAPRGVNGTAAGVLAEPVRVSAAAGDLDALEGAPPRQAPGQEALEPDTEGAVETVLVAEDDAGVRSLVIRALQRQGFAVLEARDGREALDVLRHGGDRVDLLITDSTMPELTGAQLIAAARSVVPGVRVLLISGADPEMNGGVPYLAKPFGPAQLVERVREVLRA